MTNYKKVSVVYICLCLVILSTTAIKVGAFPSEGNLTGQNVYNITGCNIDNYTCLQHYLTCMKDNDGNCCPPHPVCGGALPDCNGCSNYGDAYTTSPKFQQVSWVLNSSQLLEKAHTDSNRLILKISGNSVNIIQLTRYK
jgi:hypothetical protein